MKSFADWTDDIRLLMNPPKPKRDGNHGGHRCADPEFWDDPEAATWAPNLIDVFTSSWKPKVLGFDLGELGGGVTATNIKPVGVTWRGVAEKAMEVDIGQDTLTVVGVHE